MHDSKSAAKPNETKQHVSPPCKRWYARHGTQKTLLYHYNRARLAAGWYVAKLTAHSPLHSSWQHPNSYPMIWWTHVTTISLGAPWVINTKYRGGGGQLATSNPAARRALLYWSILHSKCKRKAEKLTCKTQTRNK